MKNKFLKFGGALMIAASVFAFTTVTAAVAYPEADCDTYCQYSNSFNCILTYSDGGTQTCHYNRPNGTLPETPTMA